MKVGIKDPGFTDNPITHHRVCANEILPPGSRYRKPARLKLKFKRDRTPPAVVFSLDGPCKGSIPDVVDVGLRLAREAIDRGDEEYARRVMNRIKSIALEQKRDALVRQLKKVAG